jgi:hypothetical protein
MEYHKTEQLLKLKNLVRKSETVRDSPKEFIICDTQRDVADRIQRQHRIDHPNVTITIADSEEFPRERLNGLLL